MDAKAPRRRAEAKPGATAGAALKPLQVGLLGIGTVGLGTWTVLRRNEEEITRRAGRPIRITWIADPAQNRAREATRGAGSAGHQVWKVYRRLFSDHLPHQYSSPTLLSRERTSFNKCMFQRKCSMNARDSQEAFFNLQNDFLCPFVQPTNCSLAQYQFHPL